MNYQKLDKIVDIFSTNNALCIGDMMLDEYISGPITLSPDAPVPVIRQKDIQQSLGGVGNVASNLAALGCTTTVLYAAAKDAESVKIEQMLLEHGIKSYPFSAATITTKKQRVLAYGRPLCRIDSEDRVKLTQQQEDKIIYQVSTLLPRINTIFISDYDKGLITPRIAKGIISAAKENHKYVFVDSKNDDFSKYTGATLIKANLPEFKLAMRYIAPDQKNISILEPENPNDIQQIQKLADVMRTKLDVQSIVVTLGEYGMIAANERGTIYRATTPRDVTDTTGVRDTSFALLGCAMGAFTSTENALDLANIGAGIITTKKGTSPLSSTELKTTLHNMFNAESMTMWTKAVSRD